MLSIQSEFIYLRRSNVGEDGLWSFHIGRVDRQVEEPDLSIGLGKQFTFYFSAARERRYKRANGMYIVALCI